MKRKLLKRKKLWLRCWWSKFPELFRRRGDKFANGGKNDHSGKSF